MKEIEKEKFQRTLDSYVKKSSRKSETKGTKSPTLLELTPSLVQGTIARTDFNTGMPHLDELTHHLIIVSAASLKFNSPDVTLAALIHDYFKPVFDFRQEPHKSWWSWYHFISDFGVYSQILNAFKGSINLSEVARLSQWHHNRSNCNKICQIERSDLLSALETSIPFSLPTSRTNEKFTVVHHLRVSGTYRMFLLALLRKKFVEILSREYSKRFQDVLGVFRIRYEYMPLNDVISIEEVGNLIKKDGWRIEIKDGTMIIPLPSRFHRNTFYFEYYEGSKVIVDIDNKAKNVRGVKIPFGMALSTVYLVGSQNAYLLYADAGFEPLALNEIVEEMVSDLKQSKKQKEAFKQVDFGKVASSLAGEFNSEEPCVFCGEPGEVVTKNEKISSVLKNKFTDTWLLLRHAGVVCPACKLGFEIEELFRASGLNEYVPQEALVSDVRIIHKVPIFTRTEFLRSISSKIWLELLSEIYYALQDTKELSKITKTKGWAVRFYLDPTILLYPYKLEIVPQVTTVALGHQKKKFVLQSGLHSGVVFPGNEKDLLPEEFLAMRRAYTSNPNLGIYLLQKLRTVYSPIFGVPKVEIRRGESHERKRKR